MIGRPVQRVNCVVVLCVGILAIIFSGPRTMCAQENRTVWSGIYTTAQAERGQGEYNDHCAGCHKDNLTGYDSVLLGVRFMQHWREDTLDTFFGTMKRTMPRGAPASLPDESYIAITAYVLQTNNFPAGKSELNAETMRVIRVEGKSGPEPLPTGALVDTVGCLEQSSDKWVLTSATEGVRARNPSNSNAEELKRWEAKPLGDHKFELTDASLYLPESLKGYKVEAKGFLIKNSATDRINLTSLQMTATKCIELTKSGQ